MRVSLRPLDNEETLKACWELKISEQQRQEAFLDDTQKIIVDALSEKDLMRLVVFDDAANVAVGYAQIRGFPAHMTYDIGKFFIDERFQGKGYGTAALKMIVADLFARSDCQKITVTYMDFNEAAVSFYKKAGFVEIENDDGFVHTELVREGQKE